MKLSKLLAYVTLSMAFNLVPTESYDINHMIWVTILFCENHYFEQTNSNRIFNIIINIKEVSMIILNLYLVIFFSTGF